jgi:methanogenic corrinoid protein MtbC1
MSHKKTALDAVRQAFGEVLGADEAKKRVKAALDTSASLMEIIQSLREGLEIVGRRYQAQEYFLSELIMAGVMAEEVTNLLRPLLAASSTNMAGRVMIGTVRGDIHDIGKKLVSTMLMSAGLDVADIGADVPVEDFVIGAQNKNPEILAMSCLLTNAMDQMKNVVAALERAGLRSHLRVLIGGRPISKGFAREIGADGYGADAVEAVKVVKDFLG